MKGSFDLGNLAAVIMKGDEPVLRFAFKDGFLIFYYRVTPLSRQGLVESLREYGIPAQYEAMIRAGKGHCIHDDYYLADLK